MIVDVENSFFEDLFESLQIENHAGHRVGFAFDGHFDYIVVAVAERIGGRPVNRARSRRRSSWGERQMCEAENSTFFDISIGCTMDWSV